LLLGPLLRKVSTPACDWMDSGMQRGPVDELGHSFTTPLSTYSHEIDEYEDRARSILLPRFGKLDPRPRRND
jgi:hypothetical protein